MSRRIIRPQRQRPPRRGNRLLEFPRLAQRVGQIRVRLRIIGIQFQRRFVCRDRFLRLIRFRQGGPKIALVISRLRRGGDRARKKRDPFLQVAQLTLNDPQNVQDGGIVRISGMSDPI